NTHNAEFPTGVAPGPALANAPTSQRLPATAGLRCAMVRARTARLSRQPGRHCQDADRWRDSAGPSAARTGSAGADLAFRPGVQGVIHRELQLELALIVDVEQREAVSNREQAR